MANKQRKKGIVWIVLIVALVFNLILNLHRKEGFFLLAPVIGVLLLLHIQRVKNQLRRFILRNSEG